jgi:predicted transcriptional regulator
MRTPEIARFLTASPDRFQLLSRLCAEPGRPSELAEDLGISHRSVQRNLGELVERGLAEKREGAYAPTTAGELVAERHEAYLDVLGIVEEYEQFFRHLPDAEHTPDPEWLDDADGAVASPEYPQAPVDHYVETLGSLDPDRIRMISPVLSRQFHRIHARQALRGAETELVLSAELVERARSLNPAEFAVVLRVDGFALYRHPDDVAFGLTIADDTALVSACDDAGQIRACVSTADTAFLSWARERYEHYRERSRRVEPDGVLESLRR